MAVEEGDGGVDLKALDAKKKAENKGKAKWKNWGKYTKKNPKHKEHKAYCKNLKSGNNPLVQALEKCGYYDIVFHHTPTHTPQTGSYRVNFVDHLALDNTPFNVRVPDESGFLLPVDNENCISGACNFDTIDLVRKCAKDAKLRAATNTIPFNGYNWKIVTKLERTGDQGALLVGATKKLHSIVKDGYFELKDGATAYWQQYDNGVAVEGAFSYVPKEVMNISAGEKYVVGITDDTEFDRLAVASGTPYDEATWSDMRRNVIGREVTVVDFVDIGDWVGYNVKVTCDHGEGNIIEATLPITMLRKELGETALLLGEVGQYVWKAECDLFECRGHLARYENIQPWVSDFVGIILLFGDDEHGFADFEIDDDDEENKANLNGFRDPIKNYLLQNHANEVDYESLGFSAE